MEQPYWAVSSWVKHSIKSDNYATDKPTEIRYVSCLAESTVAEDLRIIIRDLYRHGGIRHFYCGMATGFDLLAAEAVLELKEQLPDITLSAVVPYRNQSERFYPSAKAKYAQLLNKADDVVVLRNITAAVSSHATTICSSVVSC